MKRNGILAASLLLATQAYGAGSDVLRDIMGETVYRQSGIEQLSEEQIRVLEQWVLDNARTPPNVEPSPTVAEPAERETPAPGRPIAGDTPAVEPAPEKREAPAVTSARPAASRPPAPTSPPAMERADDPEVIRSRIDGHFEGWRGNSTRFRLENGQIWEQRQSSTFVTDLESPEIVIRRNWFGYTMEVPAIDRKVHVRRIR